MRPFAQFCLAVVVAVTAVAAQDVAAEEAVDAVSVGQPAVMPEQFDGDLSKMPFLPSTVSAPPIYRPLLKPPLAKSKERIAPDPEPTDLVGGPRPPMPSAIANFPGMSRTDACTGGACGSGWPPDTTGDVGPNHYIQAVNSSVAIYSKAGTQLASFTENQLWSGVGSTPCNGNAHGDPVVLYDWLADRWVMSWFAFAVVGGSPVSPYYQCFAASKTGDPVAGGWWLYAVRFDPGGAGLPPVGDLNDYAKIGLWHDCLYIATNQFTNAAVYNGVAFGSFSRADMYAGAPLTYALGVIGPASNAFTMIPSNNQGKGANAAQPGTPNYFVSESGTAFAFEVRKFTPGANCGGGGTMSALTNVSQASYALNFNQVPQPNTAVTLDNVGDRLMQKVQYRKIGGVESLWVTHNVDVGRIAMQWAQINVTGGTIVTTPVQQQIYAPDASLHRWMGSLAVDGQGNMALGYSTSNGIAPNFPSIAYSGRLATDPPNTLPQTEVQLVAGLGSQTNNCGGGPCHRWGDYSSMSVDPADDCTFWYTNEYYTSQANGTIGNWNTRIGSFRFPSCTTAVSTKRKIDFNADGKSDLSWKNAATGASSLWLMNGTATLSSAIVLSDPNWSVTHTGDLSGDGKTDLVWRSVAGSTAAWLQNGLASTTAATILADPNWVVLRAADLNGDGKADLVWRNNATGQVAAWLMNGVAATSSAVLLADGNWIVSHTGDFNGDGKADLLWRNTSTGATAIWLMNGLTTISSAVVFTSLTWSPTLVGDFNGDGKDDLVWRDTSTGSTAIWLMSGTTPTSAMTIFTSLQWAATLVGDFNGDGKDDLVWRNTSTGQSAVWLMNGVTPTAQAVVLSDPNWSITHVGDMNGNGMSDLVWRNSATGATALWLMNGTAATATATILADPNWAVSPPNGL